MSALYQVLFQFAAPQGHLVEVKRTTLPAAAPRHQVYLWLWIEARTVKTLQFVGMSNSPRQERTFVEGHLCFDPLHGVLRWKDGATVELLVVASNTLPLRLSGLIDQHLS
jgi:hypothetical protein